MSSTSGSSSSRSPQAPQAPKEKEKEPPLYEIVTLEVPQPSEEETELFKQQVGEWLKLDDQTRKLACAIRERRVHQKALSQKIQGFMIKFGYDNLNTTQGTIKSSVRTVKQPLKVVDVRLKLEDLMQAPPQNPLDYKKALETIFDAERPSIVKQSLHRRIPKVSLSLDL